MKIFHIVPGLDDGGNGMAVVARLIAKEQGNAEVIDLCQWRDVVGRQDCENVWVHGAWLPQEWLACKRILKDGKILVRMPHGSFDPVRLEYHGWKKRLVKPVEQFFHRHAYKIVATCAAEKKWIKDYLGKRCPPIEVTEIKRFFNLNALNPVNPVNPVKKSLHLLYLGRRHPLKGVEYLETVVRQTGEFFASSASFAAKNIELKVVSNAFGDELEQVWDWCDTLILPTLSENFGLVIAEALERGKRVITTDGAPAWGDGNTYGGRLIYLKGYRDGCPEKRVELLRDALKTLMP